MGHVVKFKTANLLHKDIREQRARKLGTEELQQQNVKGRWIGGENV